MKEKNIQTLKEFIKCTNGDLSFCRSGTTTKKHIYRLSKKYLDIGSPEKDLELTKWYLEHIFNQLKEKILKPSPFDKLKEERFFSLMLLRLRKESPDLYKQLQELKPEWMLR